MHTKTVEKFWKYIDEAEFDKLTEIMHEHADVILPNTKEVFAGRENYIKFNKDYPDRWYASIEKMHECKDQVITAVSIKNAQGFSLYVTSFFKFEDSLITEITEYWGENGQAPDWRKDKGYSQKYKG